MREADPLLYRLLQIGCALGGTFTFNTALPVWCLLLREAEDDDASEDTLRQVIARGPSLLSPHPGCSISPVLRGA